MRLIILHPSVISFYMDLNKLYSLETLAIDIVLYYIVFKFE